MTYSSVMDMLSNLRWRSQENRLIEERLMYNVLQIVFGLVAILLPSYFVPEGLKCTLVTCTLFHTHICTHHAVIINIHFFLCRLFFRTSYQLISSLFLILTLSKQESVRPFMYILKAVLFFIDALSSILLKPYTFIFI